MEGTLGHSGEDGHHGVGPVLLVHVREAYDVGAVAQEGATQEFVGHEYVYDLENDGLNEKRLYVRVYCWIYTGC